MNEFDQYVKHRLKAKHYIRYADDFVILSTNKEWLGEIGGIGQDKKVKRQSRHRISGSSAMETRGS